MNKAKITPEERKNKALGLAQRTAFNKIYKIYDPKHENLYNPWDGSRMEQRDNWVENIMYDYRREVDEIKKKFRESMKKEK